MCTIMKDYTDNNLHKFTPQSIDPAYKNYLRSEFRWNWSLDWDNIKKYLWHKVSALELPKTISHSGFSYTIEGISDNFEIIYYPEGGQFATHRDYLTGGSLHKNFYTVNIYLNNVKDTDGGELVIHEGGVDTVIHPKAGNAVIVDMYTYHHANPVLHGKKYLLKTWVSYGMKK